MLSFGGKTSLMNGGVFCGFDMKKSIIDFFEMKIMLIIL
jgi:hypothetical protein